MPMNSSNCHELNGLPLLGMFHVEHRCDLAQAVTGGSPQGAYALALSMSGSGFSSPGAGGDVSNSSCSCPLSADTLPR
jgi:hypothetical protein